MSTQRKASVDSDLHELKCLPPDFMFSLTQAEFESLKPPLATSSCGGARKLPLALSLHGAWRHHGRQRAQLRPGRADERFAWCVPLFSCMLCCLTTKRRVSHHDNSLAEVIEAIRSLMVPMNTCVSSYQNHTELKQYSDARDTAWSLVVYSGQVKLNGDVQG
jgi:hypothetical protein